MMITAWRASGLLVLAALLALSACGGSSGVTEVSRETTPASATQPLTPKTPTQAASAATRTPRPPTAKPLNVEVDNYRSLGTDFGLTFFGEVINSGGEDAARVQIVLTLTDAEGSVIGTGSDYILGPEILRPGEKGPFSIYVSDPPGDWAEEKLQVTFEEADDAFLLFDTYTDFEISGVTVTPGEFSGLTIRGQIDNTGTQAASLVEIVFVARDSDGSVLWVDFTFSDMDPLPPGITAPFEINASVDDVPPSWDVIAAGSED